MAAFSHAQEGSREMLGAMPGYRCQDAKGVMLQRQRFSGGGRPFDAQSVLALIAAIKRATSDAASGGATFRRVSKSAGLTRPEQEVESLPV